MRLKEKIILNLATKYARRSKASFRISYSQCGEDLIIQCVMGLLGIRKPSYVHVGAYDLITLSNSYIFLPDRFTRYMCRTKRRFV